MTTKSSNTMPGTVEKIIKPVFPGQPEKVQIVVDGADDLFREIRIENTLTDDDGEQVQLKLGAHVEVTVAAEPEGISSKVKSDMKQD